MHFITAIASKDNKSAIPKEQQLFLIIKLSNLNKLLSFAKADAFHLIKHEFMLRRQEGNTVLLFSQERQSHSACVYSEQLCKPNDNR